MDTDGKFTKEPLLICKFNPKRLISLFLFSEVNILGVIETSQDWMNHKPRCQLENWTDEFSQKYATVKNNKIAALPQNYFHM